MNFKMMNKNQTKYRISYQFANDCPVTETTYSVLLTLLMNDCITLEPSSNVCTAFSRYSEIKIIIKMLVLQKKGVQRNEYQLTCFAKARRKCYKEDGRTVAQQQNYEQYDKAHRGNPILPGQHWIYICKINLRRLIL